MQVKNITATMTWWPETAVAKIGKAFDFAGSDWNVLQRNIVSIRECKWVLTRGDWHRGHDADMK